MVVCAKKRKGKNGGLEMRMSEVGHEGGDTGLELESNRRHFGGMSALNLEVPREAVASLAESDSELQQLLRLELALALYRDAKLTPGRAAQLAGMDRWDFGRLAKERGIYTPYTVEMVEEDFANGRHQ
jgi:predicted HTH domain antitoxin